MALWVITRPAHVTFYVELVEAETEAEALEAEGEYVGYVDSDWTESTTYPPDDVQGPFENYDAASEAGATYVEGRG